MPPTPVAMCFLPADAELNARADIRNYLTALMGTTTIASAAAVQLPCTYQPGVPQIYGACDVGVGVGYDFVPFRLLSTRDGNVNFCARDFTQRAGCPRAVIAQFQNAVATSYFKMSKLYPDAAGNNAGAPWGVARQPCQVRFYSRSMARNVFCSSQHSLCGRYNRKIPLKWFAFAHVQPQYRRRQPPALPLHPTPPVLIVSKRMRWAHTPTH